MATAKRKSVKRANAVSPEHKELANAAWTRFWATRKGLPNWEGFTKAMYVRECKTCQRCGLFAAWAEPDPCLGVLPGVKFACCGHGVPYKPGNVPYVVFENGLVIRGEFASIENGPLGEKLTDTWQWADIHERKKRGEFPDD